MRRYLRISLRAMLVAVLLCGVALGVFVHRAERQRAAVAEIERLGGYVGYEASDPDAGIMAWGSGLGTSSLCNRVANVVGLDYVYRVTWFSHFPEGTEKCLPHLHRLPHLSQIIILIDGGNVDADEKRAEELKRRIQRELPSCQVEAEMFWICDDR
jgi:hypothetical protein